jgi:hypothetical protein
LRAELAELADRAFVEFTEFRRILAPGPRRVQQEIQRLEELASVIRVFNANVVVGLAQTHAYIEAMFKLGPGALTKNLDPAVAARLARQATLTDRRKRFEFVMGEAALRRRLIPAVAMRTQLERLIELSRQPNISLGVIQFRTDERVRQHHGYSVIGDPDLDNEAIVWTGTVTRTLRIRGEEEIRQYIEHFNALREAATGDKPLRAFLRELIAELPED